jgi:hypothetical protein
MNERLCFLLFLAIGFSPSIIEAENAFFINDLSIGYNSKDDKSSYLPKKESLLNSGLIQFNEKIIYNKNINGEVSIHKFLGSFELNKDENWGKSAIAGVGYGYENSGSLKGLFSLPQEIWFYRSWNNDRYYGLKKWHSGFGVKLGWNNDLHVFIDAPDIVDSVLSDSREDISGYNMDIALGWKEKLPLFLRIYGYSKEIDHCFPDKKNIYTIDSYSCHIQYYGKTFWFSAGYSFNKKEIREENLPDSSKNYNKLLEDKIYRGMGLTLNLIFCEERVLPYGEIYVMKGAKNASGAMVSGKIGIKIIF